VDLSQGDPIVQNLYSERICRKIFSNSMERFIKNESNNFIQFYFEEAHNLFPKKDDKDLSQIYNRIAKEGAKLNLGMIYATQWKNRSYRPPFTVFERPCFTGCKRPPLS
jgi:DNA helicase HerA-like ATPase